MDTKLHGYVTVIHFIDADASAVAFKLLAPNNRVAEAEAWGAFPNEVESVEVRSASRYSVEQLMGIEEL